MHDPKYLQMLGAQKTLEDTMCVTRYVSISMYVHVYRRILMSGVVMRCDILYPT